MSWDDAAVDALVIRAPYAARNKDWSIGGILTLLEQYNGLGYASKGLPSSYVWSGTDAYVAGKYVAEHVFDPRAVDKQLGCAGLILAMAAIDASVQAGVECRALHPQNGATGRRAAAGFGRPEAVDHQPGAGIARRLDLLASLQQSR